MDSMNDEEDGDFINSEENQSQPRVQVASLEKLVDYCAEEFSKLHKAFTLFFFLTAIVGRFVCFSQFVRQSITACVFVAYIFREPF